MGWTLDPHHTYVGFSAKHLGVATVRGHFATVDAEVELDDDVFGDVRSEFAADEICDSASWLHSVNFFDLSESYHPTAAGQSGAYEPVFSARAS